MEKDRYKKDDAISVDCIMMTREAALHLKETLDTWYAEAPIRRLLVIDYGSTDDTLKILRDYPRVELTISTMTLGKAFETLKNKVETPFFIWIDVGKIPEQGWYDTMLEAMSEDQGDILGSVRYNYKDGRTRLESVIMDPSQRMVGGPWFIWRPSMRGYHVDDDYVWRNLDIIIRQQLERDGGKYNLVMKTAHRCYLPPTVTDKTEMHRRHIMNAQGIIKYIPVDYAKQHASYLLNDHWLLMMSLLDKEWIRETNPEWLKILEEKRIRLWIAKKIRKIWSKATGRLTVE